MRKDLRKAIMKSSKISFCAIGQKYLEKNKKQQNFCVKLLKKNKNKTNKNKKVHFANLDVNFVSDNKKLWRIVVKRFFSNKVKAKTIIKLAENNEMNDDEIGIAKLFNEYIVQCY